MPQNHLYMIGPNIAPKLNWQIWPPGNLRLVFDYLFASAANTCGSKAENTIIFNEAICHKLQHSLVWPLTIPRSWVLTTELQRLVKERELTEGLQVRRDIRRRNLVNLEPETSVLMGQVDLVKLVVGNWKIGKSDKHRMMMIQSCSFKFYVKLSVYVRSYNDPSGWSLLPEPDFDGHETLIRDVGLEREPDLLPSIMVDAKDELFLI